LTHFDFRLLMRLARGNFGQKWSFPGFSCTYFCRRRRHNLNMRTAPKGCKEMQLY
jgi:hypothetical protein